jgi:hypothetical protein
MFKVCTKEDTRLVVYAQVLKLISAAKPMKIDVALFMDFPGSCIVSALTSPGSEMLTNTIVTFLCVLDNVS